MDKQGIFTAHARRVTPAERKELSLGNGDIWISFPGWKSRLNMNGVRPTWQYIDPDGMFGTVGPSAPVDVFEII